MNATPAPTPAPSDRPSDISLTTPHVDRAWREDFVVELRLADVPGDRIGDALATVDAHCADSGQSAAEAFGDPVAYARAVRGNGSGHGTALRPRTVVGLLLGLAGLIAVPRAVDAWAEATAVVVSGGDLVALGLCVGAVILLLARPTPILRQVFRRRSLAFVLPFGLLTVFLLPQALWREPVAQSAWPLPAAVGVVALILQVVLTWPALTESDPIRDPRVSTPSRPQIEWALAFLFPFLTMIMLGVDAVFRLLA
ncbi:hypothetical protein [Micromonospora sp. WMMD1082]|uniref:hypothetical protein n=1 Tax=Micromonospora sp. WMMD1082 TaxID=3016104 RepID=UPI002415F8C5|nr:hypothetical protein [Micromonospora sp. WMMD1082]MDG4797414.1 hypothetical protein [Micromonospora sp. WMMD1082]